MALAIHLEGLLRDGKVKNQAELARLRHVSRPQLTQIMNLLTLRFQEFVGNSDVNGTSRLFAAAEAEPVGFAVGGEGEDCVVGQRAVGLVKIPRGDRGLNSGGGDVGPSGLGKQPQRKLQRAAFGRESA